MGQACTRAGTLLLVIFGFVAAASAQAATTPAQALRSLRTTLRHDVQQAGGRDGVLVVDQTTHRTLFSTAAGVRRLPASVQKLYTTTTALLKLGARTRLQTGIYGVGTLQPGGIWQGTVYLRGAGDPTFGDMSFDRAAYGTGATVQALVGSLGRAGITGIQGQIVGDESYFDSLRGTPATKYAPNLEVEGELSGLAFDAGFTSSAENALQAHPARFAAQRLAAALRSAGISVPSGTRIRAGITPATARLLASAPSPPVSSLIELTNSPSDNFFAETLLKDVGARFGGGGTTTRGAAVVRSFIARRFGLHPQLNDGSGLSRADWTSPAQVVSLLEHMGGNRSFTNSLSVAGVRGTMQSEMTHTRAAHNCRGKTGTLHDVANLVGYCRARNGDRLVFAFLFNGQVNTYTGHALEDRMGVALANYYP